MKQIIKKLMLFSMSFIITISFLGNVFPSAIAKEIAVDRGINNGNTGDCTWTLSSDGVLTVSGKGMMEDYSYVDSAPWEKNRVIKVVIDDEVEGIGSYAFYNCENLTNVSISRSVTIIGESSFHGCTKLTNLNIPNGVIKIESYAFEDCRSLKNISIPESVTELGYYNPFCGCVNLKTITVADNNSVYDSRNNCNAIIRTDINELICGCQTTKIPTDITDIGTYSFAGCENLDSIMIPNGVNSISKGAFLSCTSLSSIEIPESVTDINLMAFFQCSGLKTIKISSNNPVYDSRNNCNAIIETQNNLLYFGCKNTVIPDSVTSIGDSAFAECTELVNIKIPISVTSIGFRAFFGCSSMVSIRIPDSVTSIANLSFGYYGTTIPIKTADFRIYGKEDSAAEEYAIKNGFQFISVYDDVQIGDLDEDGESTSKDRVYLARYLAKWIGYETINAEAADVNQDNQVNAKDRIILARHLANWKGYETLPVNSN